MKTDRAFFAEAYDEAEFAAKHGLTIKQAKVVIQSNGPSRHKCDLAAVAFIRALDLRSQRPRTNSRARNQADSAPRASNPSEPELIHDPDRPFT